MGQAKARGNFQQRRMQAIMQGRGNKPMRVAKGKFHGSGLTGFFSSPKEPGRAFMVLEGVPPGAELVTVVYDGEQKEGIAVFRHDSFEETTMSNAPMIDVNYQALQLQTGVSGEGTDA